MKKKFIFILKISILVLLFFWIVMVFTDYFRIRQSKKPMFCISTQEKEYDDGITYICNGVGYKTIIYDRTCITAFEFGSVFIKERTC
jgi:hypothetical protein